MKRVSYIFFFLCLMLFSQCVKNNSSHFLLFKPLQDTIKAYIASIDTLPQYYKGRPVIVSIFLFEEGGFSKMEMVTHLGPDGFVWETDRDSSVFSIQCTGRIDGRVVVFSSNPKFKRIINREKFTLPINDPFRDWKCADDNQEMHYPRSWWRLREYIIEEDYSISLIYRDP